MFQINPLFAVPFVEVQHPDSDALNRQLRELLLAREAEGPRYANPNPSMKGPREEVFESEFTLFAWPDAPVQALREFCWSALSRAIAQLNGFGPDQMNQLQIQSHTWFHITRPGGQFGLHNHPMASWSGVYCVDAGDSDPGDLNSGALTFVNPMAIAHMFNDPANVHVRRPYSSGNLVYAFRPGRLVLFPSWVFHHVQPYRGTRERITVAFNCWFKLPDGV
jgi:hypothetical protein